MYRWLPTLLVFGTLLGGAFAQPERTHLTVLSTTDLRGRIHPVHYYTGEPVNHGLAKVGSLIKRARLLDPELILIDSGDTIEGTPYAYHATIVEPATPNPMMQVMNHLRYDAMVPGNHEFNFGLDALNRARRAARFPWISANICLEGTEDPANAPYIIKQVRGVRVGVLGLTTPIVPTWEDAENFAGLDFVDPVKAAQRWVRELRRRNRVDIVIVAMHMGLEEDILSGAPIPSQFPNENAAVQIAREVPGIDLILMGHTQNEVPALDINGVLLTQAGKDGEFLSRTILMLERTEPTAGWKVVGKTATTHPMTDEVPANPNILKMSEDSYAAAETWLDRPIGFSPGALSAARSRFEDTAIMDLIHQAQLDAGEADVSLAASFNPEARLNSGEITVRDIAQLYPYENTLFVVELTGSELRAVLEHAAGYFGPVQRGQPLETALNPGMPGFAYDMAEGVDYVIDVSKPVGERITELSFRGRPLRDDQKLRVAINNYRRNGGGGYPALSEAPVLRRSTDSVRDLIIEWVRTHADIPMHPNNNWRIERP